MKSTIIILITFLHINTGLFSQKENDPVNNIELHLMPLTLFDPLPRLRLGVEIYAENNFAYNIDVGIGNPYLSFSSIDPFNNKKQYKFHELRTEIKKYKNNHQLKKNYYTSLELFYLQASYIIDESYYFKNNSNIEPISFDSAKFKKTKFGMHLKVGKKIFLYKKLLIDYYAGTGLARKKISFNNIINPDYNDDDIFTEWLVPRDVKEGKSIVLHFTLGIKIAYIIW